MQLNDVLQYGETAKKNVITGVNKIADAVKVTMGPGGRLVVIAQPGKQLPIVTKDGVTVAEAITLVDPVENMGADLVKQPSRQTVNKQGDGTTTATVLVQRLVEHYAVVKNVREFRKGLEDAKEATISFLAERKMVDCPYELLYKVALTSANGDEAIAKDVAELVKAVGVNGIIDVLMTEMSNTSAYFEPGYRFPESGIPSSRFVNNQSTSSCELTEGFVLLVGERIDNFKWIEGVAAHAKRENKNLIIVAPDYAPEVINNCAENMARKLMNIIPLKTTEFGNRMLPSLEDLAIYCLGDIFSMEDLKYGSEKRLGVFTSFRGTTKSAGLITNDNQKVVMDRLKHLQNLLKDVDNPMDESKLKQRVAQLSAAFGVIKVGGNTPAEIKERFDRYEDTVGACMSAQKGGILPGGGTALFKAKQLLPIIEGSPDYTLGYSTLIKALDTPIKQILENADIAWNDVELAQTDFAIGIDATNEEVVDMYRKGIIDPFNVTVSALISATSTAALIMSIGCVVDTTPELSLN